MNTSHYIIAGEEYKFRLAWREEWYREPIYSYCDEGETQLVSDIVMTLFNLIRSSISSETIKHYLETDGLLFLELIGQPNMCKEILEIVFNDHICPWNSDLKEKISDTLKVY